MIRRIVETTLKLWTTKSRPVVIKAGVDCLFEKPEHNRIVKSIIGMMSGLHFRKPEFTLFWRYVVDEIVPVITCGDVATPLK